MTPAQRRKKLASFKSGKTKRPFSWNKIIAIFAILLAFFGYIFATSSFFGKTSKLSVVVNDRDSVLITTFDKDEGSITNLLVPGTTQVNVSRQLGTWKIASVWKLGENEKLEGSLLAETVIKNFKIPVTGWADKPFSAISQGDLIASFKALLGYKTNLGVGDRLRLAFFSLGVSPIKRVNIDLADQNFLRKTRLIGGEEGYLVSGNLPQSLNSIFSDSKINSLKPTILIEDYQIKGGGVDILASTLEVLGGKVTAITKKGTKEFYCEVSGTDKYTVATVIKIFGCTKSQDPNESNFDLTVKVGENFGKRF